MNRFYEVELTQNSKMFSSQEEVEFSDKNSDESPLRSSAEYEFEHESYGLWSLVFKKEYHTFNFF